MTRASPVVTAQSDRRQGFSVDNFTPRRGGDQQGADDLSEIARWANYSSSWLSATHTRFLSSESLGL
jgi:hypothetical protein